MNLGLNLNLNAKLIDVEKINQISPAMKNIISRTRYNVIPAREIVLGLTTSPQMRPSAHL